MRRILSLIIAGVIALCGGRGAGQAEPAASWDGSLREKRAAIEAMPGYGPFFRCAEGYAYGWWLKNLIATASPLLKGFELTF